MLAFFVIQNRVCYIPFLLDFDHSSIMSVVPNNRSQLNTATSRALNRIANTYIHSDSINEASSTRALAGDDHEQSSTWVDSLAQLDRLFSGGLLRFCYNLIDIVLLSLGLHYVFIWPLAFLVRCRGLAFGTCLAQYLPAPITVPLVEMLRERLPDNPGATNPNPPVSPDTIETLPKVVFDPISDEFNQTQWSFHLPNGLSGR
ncbi:unnamed protein product [Rotaria sordida]|uniref:Uncharacterized protein n=1 Tax=Rotaria sordida TaxID=392033 RepID=A0A819I4R3_9BILA|nr:unnamed protein product [Rotaria sordida]